MANPAAVASVLLNILAVVEAGFNLKAVVDKVRMLYAAGATDEQVSKYLVDLRDFTLKELEDLQ